MTDFSPVVSIVYGATSAIIGPEVALPHGARQFALQTSGGATGYRADIEASVDGINWIFQNSASSDGYVSTGLGGPYAYVRVNVRTAPTSGAVTAAAVGIA